MCARALYPFHRKKDERVEWLYRGPGSSVNREEYLLGKKIDKMVDPTLVEEEREREVRKFWGLSQMGNSWSIYSYVWPTYCSHHPLTPHRALPGS